MEPFSLSLSVQDVWTRLHIAKNRPSRPSRGDERERERERESLLLFTDCEEPRGASAVDAWAAVHQCLRVRRVATSR